MKGTLIVGVLLIVFGVAALVYPAINFTTKKNVVDAGPVQINKTEHHSLPLSPIVGVVAIVGGIALMVAGAKK